MPKWKGCTVFTIQSNDSGFGYLSNDKQQKQHPKPHGVSRRDSRMDEMGNVPKLILKRNMLSFGEMLSLSFAVKIRARLIHLASVKLPLSIEQWSWILLPLPRFLWTRCVESIQWCIYVCYLQCKHLAWPSSLCACTHVNAQTQIFIQKEGKLKIDLSKNCDGNMVFHQLVDMLPPVPWQQRQIDKKQNSAQSV